MLPDYHRELCKQLKSPTYTHVMPFSEMREQRGSPDFLRTSYSFQAQCQYRNHTVSCVNSATRQHLWGLATLLSVASLLQQLSQLR